VVYVGFIQCVWKDGDAKIRQLPSCCHRLAAQVRLVARLAVTAIPDEKKGDRLVVVDTEEAGEKEDLVRIGKESDLPNLWRPQPEHFVKVAALPLLGSGKLDLRALRKLAEECVG
jgi:acyl-[acyl-carrier-protein]-phospholipid O-acyltransferase/long-chain-fatty-acid--[acyl-carrier-protein] ligase